MRRNESVLCKYLLLALLFGMAVPLRADVICEKPEDAGDNDCLYLLLPSITEEPDPINSAGREANPAGGSIPDHVAFEDDAPHVVTNGGTTIAVWAEITAGNSDVVFSEWRPEGWHEVRLTVAGSEERDPRAAIAGNGEIYVTWWETEEPRRIRVARRDPVTNLWEQPAGFDEIFGARPSVLVLEEEVLLAFERRAWSGGQEVVVRRVRRHGGPAGAFEDVLASTRRVAPLEIQLHDYIDRPFIDWIDSTEFLGYSEYRNGLWGVSSVTRPLTERADGIGARRDVTPSFQQ